MAELLRADGGLVRLSTLLQVADFEALTGRLVASSGVEIGFWRGDVVRASARGLLGLSALYESFLVPLGAVVVESTEQPEAEPLAPLIAMIVEGSRLADEWLRLSEMALSLQGALPAGLSADVVRLATRSDGRRRLGALVDIYGTARCNIVDPLLMLVESGILVAARSGSQPAISMPTSIGSGTTVDDFDDCVSQARQQVRAGRYDLARALFERAQLLRPLDATVRQNLRRLDQLEGDRFS